MEQPRSSGADSGDGAADDPRAGGRGKAPRTERGRRTLRKLLDAAAVEFGEHGFHEASISAITRRAGTALRSEEHTSELQSLMRISYAVFFLKKEIKDTNTKLNELPSQTTL